MALPLNSSHTKSVLGSLHPNIKIFRFPDHLPKTGNVLFWALHDKIVIIDENLGFLGGLDVCMGRFDDPEHSVGDDDGGDDIWIGQD